MAASADDKFGSVVRALRLAKRVTLRKFAQAVGISPSYLSKVERNDLPPPAADKVAHIADALGYSIKAMLTMAGRAVAQPKKPRGTFGATVRALRKERQITLRTFAQLVGMSPTYLSKVERDEFSPPSEKLVIRIASSLGQDPNEMLALAGRISGDLAEIFRKHPRHYSAFLHATRDLDDTTLENILVKMASSRYPGISDEEREDMQSHIQQIQEQRRNKKGSRNPQ